jgi:hypothetical protein
MTRGKRKDLSGEERSQIMSYHKLKVSASFGTFFWHSSYVEFGTTFFRFGTVFVCFGTAADFRNSRLVF